LHAAVAAAVLLTGCASLTLAGALGLGPGFAVKSGLALLASVLAAWPWLRAEEAQIRFGAANQVTLLRVVLVMLVAGFLGERATGALAWAAAGTALLAAALDGVDGWLARHRGTASAFGARFDMETDALLVLVLSLLVWQWDRAGAWVLLAGFARYAFVCAGRVAPWMRRELPPSRRRQGACVAQTLALIACLSPALAPAAASAVAGLGVAALAVSFTIDTLWLIRHRREG
jgi:phosphatidylglycerophosphate synthase